MLVAQTVLDMTPAQAGALALALGLLIGGGIIYTWWIERQPQQPHKRQRATATGREGSSPSAPFAVERPPVAAPAPAPRDEPRPVAVPGVGLDVLADSLNVAIIGPKGSGKTTLLGRLLTLRAGYVEALDPHNEPGKWPVPVVGGGEHFDVIHQRLLVAYTLMGQRYGASHRGERRQADYQTPAWSVTLAGDEWGGIVGELPDVRGTKDRPAVLGAGSLLGKVLARGRKVGLGVIVAAHDDTASQIGLGGEMGLIQCFDWLVYLGGAATGDTAIPIEVRRAAQRQAWPAVALATDRQEWYLLDTRAAARGLDRGGWVMPEDYALAVNLAVPVAATPATVLSDPATVLQPPLQVLQASQRDVAPSVAVAEPTVAPAEVAFITVQLQRGKALGAIAKMLPGYNARNYQDCKAKVEYVKALLDEQGLSSASDDDQADESSEAQRVTRAA